MDHLRHIGSRRRWRDVILVCCVILGGCASGPGGAPRDALDRAIDAYIEGDHREAIAQLEALTRTDAPDEIKREVYYYLGRSHLELGEEAGAMDAFATGVRMGDDGPCLEYLRKLQDKAGGDPRQARMLDRVTRGQLASLLVSMLADNPEAADASGTLEFAVEQGWMRKLPDGDLHALEPVTRASFYVIVSRVLSQRGAPGGTASVLLGPWPTEKSYIRGTEAVQVLERVAQLRTNG